LIFFTTDQQTRPNREDNETRFQRFGIGCLSAQPAGLGWYDGRLWRCAMQKCRSAGLGNYARNPNSSAPACWRFAHGKVGFARARLALVDKRGDKSPQSNRCRADKTSCRMALPRVRQR